MNRRINTIRVILLILIGNAFSVQKNGEQTWKYHEKDPSRQICFAMYTVHNNILKMTVQLNPLQDQDSRDIYLEIEKNGKWQTIATSTVRENDYVLNKAKSWNALFRVEHWDQTKDWRYRVVALDHVATYEGIIRKDPVDKNEIVVAAFTGNSRKDRRMKPDIISNIKKNGITLGVGKSQLVLL